ncbi:hypothetical protein [Actinoallomurus acaciae]|uniref:Uncharacterized protein n=1 Tax=Actinoallomurus acaciae TaxID=502577 RepID=A0ABV5YM03_9ACTN
MPALRVSAERVVACAVMTEDFARTTGMSLEAGLVTGASMMNPPSISRPEAASTQTGVRAVVL